jgi:hypothetical protein
MQSLTAKSGFHHSNGFINTVLYSDEYNTHPTTVTTCGDDFGFTGEQCSLGTVLGRAFFYVICFFLLKGAVGNLRRQYRALANYESGYCIIATPKEKTQWDKYQKQLVALLDCRSFLAFFARPLELAKTIEKRARELMTEWRRVNASKESLGRRRPVDFKQEITRYQWTKRNGVAETSVYEYVLSTYGHTDRVKNSPTPRIEIGDLKVCFLFLCVSLPWLCHLFHFLSFQLLIKLRTTVGALDIPDKSGSDGDGLRSDGYGYNVQLSHFLGLLRSVQFEKLVRDTEKDVRGAVSNTAAVRCASILLEEEAAEEEEGGKTVPEEDEEAVYEEDAGAVEAAHRGGELTYVPAERMQ